MAPDLAPVVDDAGGRVVAHGAAAQRVGSEDLPHRPAVEEAGAEMTAGRLADGGHGFDHFLVELTVAGRTPVDVHRIAVEPDPAVGAVGAHAEERNGVGRAGPADDGVQLEAEAAGAAGGAHGPVGVPGPAPGHPPQPAPPAPRPALGVP